MGTSKVIAFANQKGGVAKTTTTLNLAVAFAEEGHRVLCVDMDPQGNLTMSQGIDPDSLEKSMYDVLVHGIPIRDIIRQREVDVACASIDLAGAEIAMSTMIGRERRLQKASCFVQRVLEAVADAGRDGDLFVGRRRSQTENVGGEAGAAGDDALVYAFEVHVRTLRQAVVRAQ